MTREAVPPEPGDMTTSTTLVHRPASLVKKREFKPLVAQPDGRLVFAGYRKAAGLKHLEWHLGLPIKKRWCDPTCFARSFDPGMDSPKRRVKARREMLTLISYALSLPQPQLVVAEYNIHGHLKDGGGRVVGRGHGELLALKLFDPTSPHETDLTAHRIAVMEQRLTLTATQRLLIRSLAGLDG